MADPTPPFAPDLTRYRPRLVRYVRALVGDADFAEDVVQDVLVRAVHAAPPVADERAFTAWLFRVARNAVIDVHRRQAREARRVERYLAETEALLDDAPQPVSCGCYHTLLPRLKPEYADLIVSVELGGEPLEHAARRLGITRNNLKVRRHRARQQLRQRLDETCGVCATHGCLDCSCQSS